MVITFSAPSARVFTASLLVMLVGFGMYFDHVASDGVQEQARAALERELVRESASPEVRRLARWAVSTQDHAGMPFVVIDKADARIYAFDPRGRLRGSAPVLLGAARADEAGPPATPAGRFTASTLASARRGGIVWANSKGQITLYAVPSVQDGELRRLDSPHAKDKRVSTGSLHVASGFYREYLDALRTQPSIAYVLPETVPLDQVFGAAPPGPEVGREESSRRPS